MVLFCLLLTRLVRITSRQFLMFLILTLLELLAFLVLFLLEFLLLLLIFPVSLGIPSIRGTGAVHRRKVPGMIAASGGPAVLISRWSSFTRGNRRTIIRRAVVTASILSVRRRMVWGSRFSGRNTFTAA